MRRRRILSSVASVEVDAPGCSYNPDHEQHQDAVAAAVAAEVRKAIDTELQPIAPPRIVDYQPEVDELMLLQVRVWTVDISLLVQLLWQECVLGQ